VVSLLNLPSGLHPVESQFEFVIFQTKLQLDSGLLRGISVRQLPNMAGPAEMGWVRNTDRRK
jgi:hypothetical protein